MASAVDKTEMRGSAGRCCGRVCAREEADGCGTDPGQAGCHAGCLRMAGKRRPVANWNRVPPLVRRGPTTGQMGPHRRLGRAARHGRSMPSLSTLWEARMASQSPGVQYGEVTGTLPSIPSTFSR